jgi:hypothetical protein
MHSAPGKIVVSKQVMIIQELSRQGFIDALADANDTSGGNTDSKFDMPSELLIFGDKSKFKDGLTRYIHKLDRSMEEECRDNDNGHWYSEYQYIVHEVAFEQVSSYNSGRIRDKGHGGMRVDDFTNHPIAKQCKLTQAEVVALRLYTGPMYKAFNNALRQVETDPSQLERWKTCISVLYSAVVSLSLNQTKKRVVYRGADKRLSEEFFNKPDDEVVGGTELAFVSTSLDYKVAISYASKDRKKEFTIFEIPLDGISNGADVQWVSQYPEEEEVIIPPCTYLSRTKVSMLTKNISHITVRADISTARPYIGNIKTTTDKIRKRRVSEKSF